jgi:hypothetical protein
MIYQKGKNQRGRNIVSQNAQSPLQGSGLLICRGNCHEAGGIKSNCKDKGESCRGSKRR